MLQLKKRRKVESLTSFERNRPKEGLDFDETSDSSVVSSDPEQQTSSNDEVPPEIASFSERPTATRSTDVIDALAAAEEEAERKEASNKRNAPHSDRLEEKIASTSHQTSRTTNPKPSSSSHQHQATTAGLGMTGIDRNSKRVKLAQALVANPNLEYRNKEEDPNEVAASIEEKCWTSCSGNKSVYLQSLSKALTNLKRGR